MESVTGEVININNKYGSYQEYKAAFDQRMQKTAEDFVWFGYHLKLARDTDILKESGYGSVNEFAEAEYGLDKSQVSRFIRINDEYSENGYSDRLQEKYRDFGHAKLAIMLTLPAAVSEELTASYTKSEIGMIKEEIDAERNVSDLEVMMEEKDRMQEKFGLVGKVLYQMGHDDPEVFIKLYDAAMKTEADEDGDDFVPCVNALTELLAPSGEAIHSVRIAGEGRKLLSIKGPETDPVIIDVRSGDKHYVRWNDFLEEAISLCLKTVEGKEGWERLYGEPFPVKEEDKKAPVAPVQPKKEKKVTKAKVEKPADPHKDQAEGENSVQEGSHETEAAQTTQDTAIEESPAAVVGNTDSEASGIDRNEPESADHASGTDDGAGTPSAGDDEDAGNEPQAAGQLDGQMNIEDFPEYLPAKDQKPQQSNVPAGYLMALKDNLDMVYLLAEKGNIAGAEDRLEAVRGTLHKIAELVEA